MSNLSNLGKRDTYYVERANGRFEYWMYCEGLRVYVSKKTADKDVARGFAKLVRV